MNKKSTFRAFTPFVLAGTVLCMASLSSAGGGGGDETRVDHEFVVTLVPGADLGAVALSVGAQVIEANSLRRLFLLQVPAGADDDAVVLMLESDPRVLSIDYHRRLLPSEPVTQSFFLRDIEQNYDQQEQSLPIGLVPARQLSTGAGTLVAIIDTGIWPHTGLGTSVVPGIDYVGGPGAGIDDGAGPRVGHGTFVAGLVHLVAPDAVLIPLKVCTTDGRASTFAIASAVYDAIDLGVDVINISLSAPREDNILRDALREANNAGVVVVVAMGNAGETDARDYPADEPLAIAVAAVNNSGIRAPFSNIGGNIALCAPGVNLIGPVSGATTPDDANPYMHGDGTSLSTAIVSGACAIVRSLVPNASPARVRATIVGSATNISAANPDTAQLLGAGMVNVHAAANASLCLTDFDGNGLLTPDDLADYITAYFETIDGVPAADINDDGLVTPDDLADFISSYFDPDNGCNR